MLYLDKEYPMWKFKIDYTKHNEDSQNIIFGDSRALAGFIPNEIGENFVNLALGGGTSIENYYLLKKYSEKNIPKKIILSIAPFHMQNSDVFFARTVAFDLLSNRELQEIIDVSKKLNYNLLSNEQYKSTLDLYKFQVKSYLKLNSFFLDYRSNLKAFSLRPDRSISNFNIFKEIKNSDGQYFFGNKEYSSGLNEEAVSKKFLPNKILDYYYKKILNLASENKIKVYVINTPFNQSSFENTSLNYKNSYNEYILHLKKKYPNVIWYSELMFYSDSFFGDPSHLNKKGAKKFSKFVKNKLNNNLIAR
jgi:hypothetical protein